jgi:Arc/MetJ-type ribon-helix-helix transcriptional regulator
MNVNLAIPTEWEAYLEEPVRSGNYASVEEYFLALLQGDRQRKEDKNLRVTERNIHFSKVNKVGASLSDL